MLRKNEGVPDEVNINKFDVKQCDQPIQKDGCNYGIITLKVNDMVTFHMYK